MSFHISLLCHDFATCVTAELDQASITVSLRDHAVQHCTQVWVKGGVNRCSYLEQLLFVVGGIVHPESVTGFAVLATEFTDMLDVKVGFTVPPHVAPVSKLLATGLAGILGSAVADHGVQNCGEVYTQEVSTPEEGLAQYISPPI